MATNGNNRLLKKTSNETSLLSADIEKSASSNQQQSASSIFLVVAFYFVTSLSVVFLNKHILSTSDFRFPYPLLVTWYQLVVALVILVVCGHLGQKKGSWFALVPPFEFQPDLARKVLPLTLVYVLMLAFNNLCLELVQVTFYQVARSLSILFNIILSYFLLGTTTSSPALLSCAIVFLGFVLGSYGEINFTWSGLIFGVLSSVFVALYGIHVKKALVHVNNDQWRLLHYNTAISIMIMIPFIVVSGELGELLSRENAFGDSYFWFLMTLTGVTGFLINIAVFLQIKFTTPLTNTISGTAKACVQTLLAWVIWRNEITAMNGFGILLSLVGSGLYSYVRYREMRR